MVESDGSMKHLLDLVHPDGTYQDGTRQASTTTLPSPPRLCMRMFPEYRQRQSIKDMFNKIRSSNVDSSTQLHSKPNKRMIENSSSELSVKKPRASNRVRCSDIQSSALSDQNNLKHFFKPKESHLSQTDSAFGNVPTINNLMVKTVNFVDGFVHPTPSSTNTYALPVIQVILKTSGIDFSHKDAFPFVMFTRKPVSS